jgi:hypothetical protein
MVIKANLKYIEALKDKLLEKETVDAEEVHALHWLAPAQRRCTKPGSFAVFPFPPKNAKIR